jgi:hypothetical protein
MPIAMETLHEPKLIEEETVVQLYDVFPSLEQSTAKGKQCISSMKSIYYIRPLYVARC